jgi:hypothetical protein
VYKAKSYADDIYFIAVGKVSFHIEMVHFKFRTMSKGGWFGDWEVF